jgi:diguanylate cyclase (GGDEF)-like protein
MSPLGDLFARLRPLESVARWAVHRSVYALALLPILTDWLDTGHWPEHPRELATELVLGVLIFFGVHRLHRRAEFYRTAAETDALTGLKNRRRFRLDLGAAVTQAHASKESLVLALVDLDHFKQINDTQGHAVGDEVLQQVSDALARSVREGQDGCYRLGGDEFGVLLRNVSESQAYEILRRGFARVEAARRPNTALSCSVGLASLAPDEQPHQLLARADERMYQAKRDQDGPTFPSRAYGKLGLMLGRGRGTEHSATSTWKVAHG